MYITTIKYVQLNGTRNNVEVKYVQLEYFFQQQGIRQ